VAAAGGVAAGAVLVSESGSTPGFTTGFLIRFLEKSKLSVKIVITTSSSLLRIWPILYFFSCSHHLFFSFAENDVCPVHLLKVLSSSSFVFNGSSGFVSLGEAGGGLGFVNIASFSKAVDFRASVKFFILLGLALALALALDLALAFKIDSGSAILIVRWKQKSSTLGTHETRLLTTIQLSQYFPNMVSKRIFKSQICFELPLYINRMWIVAMSGQKKENKSWPRDLLIAYLFKRLTMRSVNLREIVSLDVLLLYTSMRDMPGKVKGS
jgi:hypothetical protein